MVALRSVFTNVVWARTLSAASLARFQAPSVPRRRWARCVPCLRGLARARGWVRIFAVFLRGHCPSPRCCPRRGRSRRQSVLQSPSCFEALGRASARVGPTLDSQRQLPNRYSLRRPWHAPQSHCGALWPRACRSGFIHVRGSPSRAARRACSLSCTFRPLWDVSPTAGCRVGPQVSWGARGVQIHNLSTGGARRSWQSTRSGSLGWRAQLRRVPGLAARSRPCSAPPGNCSAGA